MAQPVSMWRDERGFLHESEEAAVNADRGFERERRRDVVRCMLIERLRVSRGDDGWPFRASGDLADWLIQNWPSIKAIGYAFRVDELSGGEQAMASAEKV